jgi:DNA-binding beta-propeller fold protein YncE
MPRTTQSLAPLAVLCLACLAAAACTSPTTGNAAPSPSAAEPSVDASVAPAGRSDKPVGSTDAWLVVGRAGEDGLHVIRASNQERMYDLPLGVPDASWARMVAATVTGGSTTVRELQGPEQPAGRSQMVPGEWRLPTIGADPIPVGVSADGGTIVLVEADAQAGGDASRFAILSRTFDAKPRIVRLDGSFEYDAISPDGATLYLVEHLAAPPEGHYQVRAVDTASGTLRQDVVVDKSGLNEPMAGYPIAQVRQSSGFVFTLYHGAEHPFVHALSSVDGWALCIDLPASGSDDAAAALDWGLAASSSGNRVFAVNATLGLAIEIDPNDLSIRRTARFDAPASAAISLAKFGHEAGGPVGRRVIVSADGSVLYAAGSGGIVRLATNDLSTATTILAGSAVDALALTPEGTSLYALLHQAGRIVELDPLSGAVIGSVPGDGYDALVAISPL